MVRQDTPRLSESGRWITLGEACRLLGVDESTLRRWGDAGQLRTFRTPGGHRRFAESDIVQLLEGRSREPRYQQLGELALARIRRQLHRKGHEASSSAHWYPTVDDAGRERLRFLGRRLMTLVTGYLSRRGRRSALMAEVRTTGREYGAELAQSGVTIGQAVEAFAFFRRSLFQAAEQGLQKQGVSVREALVACDQIMNLADEVLVGIAEAYESKA